MAKRLQNRARQVDKAKNQAYMRKYRERKQAETDNDEAGPSAPRRSARAMGRVAQTGQCGSFNILFSLTVNIQVILCVCRCQSCG